MKINFGCGKNKLNGWINHDIDCDIRQPLKYPNRCAEAIFAEHVVEHISYHDAVLFFCECWRVLKVGGVIRIAVPSIERVMKNGTQPYFDWVRDRGWSCTNDLRGAMGAIIFQHGHQMAWTESLLQASLFYAGFQNMKRFAPNASWREGMSGLEGHGKIIGDEFNNIETLCMEGIR